LPDSNKLIVIDGGDEAVNDAAKVVIGAPRSAGNQTNPGTDQRHGRQMAAAIPELRVAQLVRKTLETKPKGGTHWSIRQIAAETRVSNSTVHRIWQAFGLEPHRQKHFKLSTDPFFVEKVRDMGRVVLASTG
jgi:hypothetical protein